MRDFWRSHEGLLGEFATRFAGSSDLYGGRGRRPTASVNLITVHDGFTLADLVSYDHKHNEANGQGNEGGTDDNRSWNCGAEGPTDDEPCSRCGQAVNAHCSTTLLLSFGVPLLLGGDELGRTQQGNNNAYCLDGPVTWFDWANVDERPARLHPSVDRLPAGPPRVPAQAVPHRCRPGTLRWYTPAGTIITGEQWADPGARSLAIHLEGQDEPDRAADGTLLLDDDFLILVNAWWEPLAFVLPQTSAGQEWVTEIDTYDPTGTATHGTCGAGERVTAGPRSIVVLRGTVRGPQPG